MKKRINRDLKQRYSNYSELKEYNLPFYIGNSVDINVLGKIVHVYIGAVDKTNKLYLINGISYEFNQIKLNKY